MVIALALACVGPSATPTDGFDIAPVELCALPGDEDGNGLPDCLDPICTCPEACDGGVDEDRDGTVDCDDRDCAGACPEVCENGWDDDLDGLVDCADPECGGTACPELCIGGRDDDDDGLIDCADPDCIGSCEELCDGGLDEDGDGLIDCSDPSCEVGCAEICSNGLDDDADGLVDCLDGECRSQCDADGDGHDALAAGGDDCRDDDPQIHPGLPERCDSDNVDEDCDGLTEDDDPFLDATTLITWHRDTDGDGWGREAVQRVSCESPPLGVDQLGDCADHNPTIHPGAAEVCDGTWDEDCDHLIDEEDPDTVVPRWWFDSDGDGVGGSAAFHDDCDPWLDFSATNDDCDDDDAAVGSPSASWHADGDGDGAGAGPALGVGCVPPSDDTVHNADDCDDADASRLPGRLEACNQIDDDCDGLIDDADPDLDCSYDLVGDPDLTCQSLAPFRPQPGEHTFGRSLVLVGDWIAVGAPDDPWGSAGAVWTFDATPEGAWLDGVVLEAGDRERSDAFGASLAADADWLAVGAPGVDEVYVYARPSLDLVVVLSDAGAGGAVALSGGAVWSTVDDGVASWILGEDAAVAGPRFTTSSVALGAWGDNVLAGGPDGLAQLQLDGTSTWLDDRPTTALATDAETWAATDGTAVWWTGASDGELSTPATSLSMNADRFAVGDPATGSVQVLDASGLLRATLLGSEPSDVHLSELEGGAPVANCIPLGGGGHGPHLALIYEGVPAFDLLPGDQLAFDATAPNDHALEADIALAVAIVDGADEPDEGGFVPVALAASAGVGNFVTGDFDLAFPVDVPFHFPGGGLIVRLTPTGDFAADLTCSGVFVVRDADGTGPVARVWADADGLPPWDQQDATRIPDLRIVLADRTERSGTALALNGPRLAIGAPAAEIPDPPPGAVQICTAATWPIW